MNVTGYFPMQYVLCVFNLLIINMVLCTNIASEGQTGDKNMPTKRKKRATMKFNFVHFNISQCTVYLDWICF